MSIGKVTDITIEVSNREGVRYILYEPLLRRTLIAESPRPVLNSTFHDGRGSLSVFAAESNLIIAHQPEVIPPVRLRGHKIPEHVQLDVEVRLLHHDGLPRAAHDMDVGKRGQRSLFLDESCQGPWIGAKARVIRGYGRSILGYSAVRNQVFGVIQVW